MRAVAIFIVNKYVALHTHYVIMLKTFSRVVLLQLSLLSKSKNI